MRSTLIQSVTDKLHLIYLVGVAPFILLLCFLSPPNAIPDEWSHLLRASQLSKGQLVGSLNRGELGGKVPAWAFEIAATPVEKWRPDITPDIDRFNGTANSSRIWANFPFSAYGPAGYIGGAVGLAAASLTDASPIERFYAGRVANALVDIALSVIAIAIAARGRLLLFVLLSMPTTIYLAGSYSQDSCLIGLVALSVGLLGRTPFSQATVKTLALASLLMGLAAAGRLAYAPLLLIPFAAAAFYPTRARVVAVLPGIAIGLLWIAFQQYAVAKTLSRFVHAPYANPREQMQYLLSDILHGPKVVITTIETLGAVHVRQFIGVAFLQLPPWVYLIMILALVISVVVGFGRYEDREKELALVVAASCILSIGATAGAMLLLWTRPGELVIDGIQGRYVIPTVAALTAVFPRQSAVPSQLRALSTIVVTGLTITAALSTVALITQTFPREIFLLP